MSVVEPEGVAPCGRFGRTAGTTRVRRAIDPTVAVVFEVDIGDLSATTRRSPPVAACAIGVRPTIGRASTAGARTRTNLACRRLLCRGLGRLGVALNPLHHGHEAI